MMSRRQQQHGIPPLQETSPLCSLLPITTHCKSQKPCQSSHSLSRTHLASLVKVQEAVLSFDEPTTYLVYFQADPFMRSPMILIMPWRTSLKLSAKLTQYIPPKTNPCSKFCFASMPRGNVMMVRLLMGYDFCLPCRPASFCCFLVLPWLPGSLYCPVCVFYLDYKRSGASIVFLFSVRPRVQRSPGPHQ